MTTFTANTTEITYKELQAWAKDNGIKANQSQAVLSQLHAEAHAPQEDVNPFEAYLPTQRPQQPTRSTNAFPPSVKTLQFLSDLRTRHRRSLVGLDTISYSEAQAEIKELQALPTPASDKQLEIIANTIKELNDAGDKINISQAKLHSLTGGREGTGSKMIEWLFARRQSLNIQQPPSDSQLDTLTEWFLCPDIPFESLSIAVEDEIKPGANMSDSHTDTVCVEKKVLMPHVSATAWRWMLPEEFKAELKAKLTRSQASKLISEYRGTFYTWKSSRTTKAQMDHIRRLDQRLANIESQAEVTFGIDQDGNVEEVSTSKKNTYNPRAHEPLSDIQLAQLSVEEAKILIDQMHSELNETYASIDNNAEQVHLNDKIRSFDERTGAGVAKTINDARIFEYTKLSDLIYKLEAVVGHANDELHDMIKETLIDGAGDSIHVTHKIREFMLLAVDNSSRERALRTSGALLQLTEDTEIGTKIAQRVSNETQAKYSRAQ